jgi:hypothetical protein
MGLQRQPENGQARRVVRRCQCARTGRELAMRAELPRSAAGSGADILASRAGGAGESPASRGPGRLGQQLRWCQCDGRGFCEIWGARGLGAGGLGAWGLGARARCCRVAREVRESSRGADFSRRQSPPRSGVPSGGPAENVGASREAREQGGAPGAGRGVGALRGAEYLLQAEALPARAAAWPPTEGVCRARLAAIDCAASRASSCGNCASSGVAWRRRPAAAPGCAPACGACGPGRPRS